MTGTSDKSGDTRPGDAPLDTAREQREYGHSSGDRNTRSEEDDWKSLEGGEQRRPAADHDELEPDGTSVRHPARGS